MNKNVNGIIKITLVQFYDFILTYRLRLPRNRSL